MIFHTSSPEETQAVAQKLAALLRPGDLIAYRGGMGVGKTTFTAGLARGLGSTAWVSSPTFALVHQYQGKLRSLPFRSVPYHLPGGPLLHRLLRLPGERGCAGGGVERKPGGGPSGAPYHH